MQHFEISQQNIIKNIKNLFTLNQIYVKNNDLQEPLLEYNTTAYKDKFDNINNINKYLSFIDLDNENRFKISINDLLLLSDLYFYKKNKNNLNEKEKEDIRNKIINVIKYNISLGDKTLVEKIDNEEPIIFEVYGLYEEEKEKDDFKYKEYQSFLSEVTEENYNLTDNFIYNNIEYNAGTFFIFADYTQTEFIIQNIEKGLCLVKSPINNELFNKINVGDTVNVSYSIRSIVDDNMSFTENSRTVRVHLKTSELFEEEGKTVEHDYIIFIMPTQHSLTSNYYISFERNPEFKPNFYDIKNRNDIKPPYIPFLHININSGNFSLLHSYEAEGLDYVSPYQKIYLNNKNIFSLFNEETKWDYISNTSMRTPLPLSDDFSLNVEEDFEKLFYYEDYSKIKGILDKIKSIQEEYQNLYDNWNHSDVVILNSPQLPQYFIYVRGLLDFIETNDIDKVKDICLLSIFNYAYSQQKSINIWIEANFNTYIYDDPIKLDIPFQQSFDISTYQDEIISDKYLSRAKNDCINDIIDMERDVYYPMWKSIDEKENPIFIPINEIQYIFHFKQRDENFQLLDFIMDKDNNNTPYNSFNNYLDSDTLGEIRFTNKDVIYQKNCLKKTFIRSTYYNTPNFGDQEVLCYNTTFVDYKGLYKKYTKNPNASVNAMNNNNKLDTKIIVRDKYSSPNSSEGFYIHVWKNNNDGIDLFNHIEYNNAKFGISSPMMILENNNGKPTIVYTIESLNKQRFIKYRAEFNDDLNKYIYYIDIPNDKNYGIVFDKNKGILQIPLWEVFLNQK